MAQEEPFSFRALYTEILGYRGSRMFDDLLMPRSADARQVVETLAAHAQKPNEPDKAAAVDLWQWYALSRVSDRLLRGIQATDDFYRSPVQRQTKPHLGEWWRSSAVTTEQYAEFFAALGLAPFGLLPFSPFHCEIVEVVEDVHLAGRPVVERVFWPGLKFGEMLFARAGVGVRCPPGLYRKNIAENSCLYFTFQRLHRRTQDLSQGWGGNSQWATAFRRDYDTGGAFYYNVDGRHPLGLKYEASFHPKELKPDDDLTPEERVELLTHRSFVRCHKDDHDCWPYDDTWQEPNGG